MPIKIRDLELKAKPPRLPASVPVFELAAPSFDERRDALARLAERLRLGTLRMAEVEHGTLFASDRGEVEYFQASGAVWARDAASQNGRNELRKWDGVKDAKRGGTRMTLSPDASKRLIGQA